MKKENWGFRDLIGGAALALLAASVVRELSIPRGDRTWHGRVIGVPYDLRRPTWRRVQESWWAPQDPRLVTPRVVGVGWSLNVGRVVALIKAWSSKDHGHLS
jgi:Family of unknown function (DUF5808)